MLKTTELIGKSFDAGGLLDYQPHAVVSRQIIKKNVGTVTLFAFDKDQGLSEHTAPFDALIQITEGKAEVMLEGKSFTVDSGQSMLLPANIPHALKAIEKFKMILIMIKS